MSAERSGFLVCWAYWLRWPGILDSGLLPSWTPRSAAAESFTGWPAVSAPVPCLSQGLPAEGDATSGCQHSWVSTRVLFLPCLGAIPPSLVLFLPCLLLTPLLLHHWCLVKLISGSSFSLSYDVHQFISDPLPGFTDVLLTEHWHSSLLEAHALC